MADNKSYVVDNSEMVEMGDGARKTSSSNKCYRYEEALELTGHGRYNSWLVLSCSMVIVAMGIDIYGLGVVVTAATCDLRMDLRQIGIVSSAPFAGIVIMSYPWGYVSDTRGRKLALMWAMSGSFLAAILSSFAPNWQALAAMRFLSSAFSSAGESATYALLGECSVGRVRARYMLLITSALMLTPALYYVCAYFIMKAQFSVELGTLDYRPWRLLTLVLALPLGVSTIMLHFCSESPKFLANVGRKPDAIQILRRIHAANGGNPEDYDVKEIYLDEKDREVSTFSLQSLWTQIAPLFRPPLLSTTLLLFYLTFVIYIANNSFASILPTLFNVFFTSLAASDARAGFCDVFLTSANTTQDQQDGVCQNTIKDNTIWAGCVHGISFFLLNAVLSRCAAKRKMLTISILVIAAAAALGVTQSPEPVAGLALFFVFLTTAMIFGIVSSYFVDLYPTSYRGMVACLGMTVARLSALLGVNVVGAALTEHCQQAFYGATVLVLSGAVVAWFLPRDADLTNLR